MGDVRLNKGKITLSPKIEIDIRLVAKILWERHNRNVIKIGRRKLLVSVREEINSLGIDNLDAAYENTEVPATFVTEVREKFKYTAKRESADEEV